MNLMSMSSKPAADVDAVTVLPVVDAWCGRRGERTNLRDSSWSFRSDRCVHGIKPCLNHGLCQRVAVALNRPGH